MDLNLIQREHWNANGCPLSRATEPHFLARVFIQFARVHGVQLISLCVQFLRCRGQQGPEPEIEPLSKVHFEQVLAHMVPPSRAAQETAAALRQRQRQRSGQAPPVGSAGMLSPQLAQALAIALQNLVSDSRRGDMPRAEYPLEESDEDGY